jgi:hypothetical protein
MGPVPVVVIHEDGEDLLEVLLIQDQQPVETLGANGPHKPLSHAVRLRRAKRRANDFQAMTSKHFVKTGGEFLISIAKG